MNATYAEKLQQRRKVVDVTLRHLERERREVEDNPEWIDRGGYEGRLSLLDELTRWYQEETAQIDRVLDRSQGARYSFCLACHEPIEADRLEICPDAEFCCDCQEYPEMLKAG